MALTMFCSNKHQFTAPVLGPNNAPCCPICGMAATGQQVIPVFPPSVLHVFDGAIRLEDDRIINAKVQAADAIRATLKLLAVAGDIASPIAGIMLEKSSPIIVPRVLPRG
jgi:hypothetical protein